MKQLTAKQQQIYDYIVSFTDEHGYPPSVREIGEYVGLKSPSTVHFHLKGLQSAGLITQAAGKTRAISISGDLPKRDRVPVVGNVAAGHPHPGRGVRGGLSDLRYRGSDRRAFRPAGAGESMLYAGILPDDLVIVHQQQDARNGEIVVAMLEDEATVKTLQRKDGHTWLMPENPDYEPIDGDRAQILGKVVAVVRKY